MVHRTLALVLIFAASSYQAARLEAAAPTGKLTAEDVAEYYELFSVLVDTLDQVERNYVKDIDRDELLKAAIQGVLSKLDPYSTFIPSDRMGEFRREVESRFGGIGIQIGVAKGVLKIVSPLVDTPASRAGLRSGDRIVEIEGESTEGISIDGAIKRLKGEAGSDVTITVLHADSSEPETMTLTREIIRVPTVLGDARREDGSWDFLLDPVNRIGYVRMTTFSRATRRELQKTLRKLEDAGMRGLILDLRSNPGGLLSSAIRVCDLFISGGRIVSTEGRNSEPRSWDATERGTFDGFPMVVLVNRYSASASEIVAACLQDHDRAVVIGERTWGKGSVQNVVELEGGKSALKLTTASYKRPSGKNIHRFPSAKQSDDWGVIPNEGFRLRLSGSEMRAMAMLSIGTHRVRDSVKLRPAGSSLETLEVTTQEEPTEGDEDGGASGSADKQSAVSSGAEGGDEESPESSEGEAGESEEPQDPDASTETEPAAGEKSDEKPADEKEERLLSDDDPHERPSGFVDRQLQRALDYLVAELSKAETAP